MQFDSFAAFLDMGGYGFFVWLSFGISAALLGLLIFASSKSASNTRLQIARQINREQKLKRAAKQQQQEVNNES
ncbi:heme exporter protein CcmD [Colwellia sp. MEBiC06753]